jgi:anti-sigma B factor antagonist
VTTQVAPARPVEFSVTETVNDDAGTIVVAVTGEVDIMTAPKLDSVLRRLQAQERSIVVDLSDVTFLDSSGLAVLLRANRMASSGGSSFSVAAELPEAVALLFEITNVSSLLTFEGSG